MMFRALILCAAVLQATALNNGLGRTPQMGYNSWYDLYMNPTESLIKDTVNALKETGLYDVGFKYVNLDDGMVIGRDSNGQLYPDPKQFPSGFAALADYIHSNGMYFGVYTDRGPKTCGGRPAAQGHEYLDANTYAQWGVDYVKEDSCNAPQDHQTAYTQYATMRDALAAAGNSSGRPIFFSLCGWNSWYAPVGHSLGNSWRIGPDDTNWDGVLTDIDDDAPLWPYAGPGGWNDPCLLLGRDISGNVAVTDQQGRFQFVMWAILAAPMLLSQNVRNLSSFQLETYLNTEIIAVGQDPLGRQGQRLVGGSMSLQRSHPDGNIPLTFQPCSASSAQQWRWNVSAPGYLTNTATGQCANLDDCASDLIAYSCVTTGGTCCGPQCYDNLIFFINPNDQTLRSPLLPGQCVTASGQGAPASMAPCTPNNGNQQLSYDPTSQTLRTSTGQCLTVGGGNQVRANIWGRPLIDGSWAIAFVNADSSPVTLTCDADCLAPTGWEPDQVLIVRDLIGHANLANITAGKGIQVSNVAPDGGVMFLKFTPVWAVNTTSPTKLRVKA